MHMGEPRDAHDTCMGSPYAYGLRKIAHAYAYRPAHTRMGKISIYTPQIEM